MGAGLPTISPGQKSSHHNHILSFNLWQKVNQSWSQIIGNTNENVEITAADFVGMKLGISIERTLQTEVVLTKKTRFD